MCISTAATGGGITGSGRPMPDPASAVVMDAAICVTGDAAAGTGASTPGDLGEA